MALFEWKDTYSVSVFKFDTQHKKLFSLINDLSDAMGQGKGKEIVGKIIGELLKYTKTHFADEETEMQKTNYAEYSRQKQEHEVFTSKVVSLESEFNAGRRSMTIELLNFLNKWLQQHILIEDKKYGSHLNSNGIK
jgi:hemerythrin